MRTSAPMTAHTCAIPWPIVPAPTTVIERTFSAVGNVTLGTYAKVAMSERPRLDWPRADPGDVSRERDGRWLRLLELGQANGCARHRHSTDARRLGGCGRRCTARCGAAGLRHRRVD